jgi:hypothetical protein
LHDDVKHSGAQPPQDLVALGGVQPGVDDLGLKTVLW